MSDWIDIPPKPTLILDDEHGNARCLNCYARTHVTARDCHWTELSDGCGIVFENITSPRFDATTCAQWRDDLNYITVEWA